jgi:hypothetical protein
VKERSLTPARPVRTGHHLAGPRGHRRAKCSPRSSQLTHPSAIALEPAASRPAFFPRASRTSNIEQPG